jgi:hypothetical protein
MNPFLARKERKHMWKRVYDVIMRTSIGARYGTMTVTVDQSKVSGMLDILKKANSFHGKIDEKGDCQIEGELTTLMHTIHYDAAGRITKEALVLKLKGERESFELSGTATAPFPVMEKEQAL